MRVFDWIPFLREHRIPYIERGANVKRGEVNIRCVFCGSADPSYHMGLNLETGWFSCWRVRKPHSGKSPLRLIMALLRVSYQRAREIAGLGEDYIDPEGFDAAAAKFMAGTKGDARATQVVPTLRMPPTFHPIIDDSSIKTRRWWNYIYSRGFDEDDVVPMAAQYDLRADRAASRLIIPYVLLDKLVSWTGRAIADATIRYLDLPVDESIVAPKYTLFNHDATLIKSKVLVIVEGPLDALKVDYYGQEFGLRAVGLSTNSVSNEQRYMLEEASARFDRTIVLMDNKTGYGLADGMRMKLELGTIPGIEVATVPNNRPDPGEMKPGEVRQWARSLTQGRRR